MRSGGHEPRAAGRWVAALALLGAARSEAQTVAGIARDRATGGPVIGVIVALRDAADSVVVRGRTDSLGTFYVATPGPGRYSVVFVFDAHHGSVSAPFTVADTAAFHQAAYVVDVPTDTVYFEHEVTKPAAPTNNVAPSYPAALQARGIEGQLVAEFVVDTLGRAEPASFVARSSTHAEFVAAVRSALPRMRFLPAEREGRKVRQLVHQAFAFAIDR